MKPRAFIASSSEGLKYAKALKKQLDASFECKLWVENDVFAPSSYTLDALIAQISMSDLGIFVYTGDDASNIRKKNYVVGRDNVLFEAGLFFGALGRENSFVLRTGEKNFHVPSDLAGLTDLRLSAGRPETAVKKPASVLLNHLASTKPNNLGRVLSGKWRQTWEVKDSSNFPDVNSSRADVVVFGNRMRAKWKVERDLYCLTGRVESSRVVVGEWFGPTTGHYRGSFQLLLSPTMTGLTGTWVGFRENGREVHSGLWTWQKI